MLRMSLNVVVAVVGVVVAVLVGRPVVKVNVGDGAVGAVGARTMMLGIIAAPLTCMAKTYIVKTR